MPDARWKPRGKAPYFAVAIVIVVTILWTFGWFVVARSTHAAIGDWMEFEQLNGRHWSCLRESMSGFPFRVAYHCESPVVTIDSNRGKFEGRLAGLTAHAVITAPSDIHAELQSPLEASSMDDRGVVRLAWKSASVDYRDSNLPGERLTIHFEKPSLGITGLLSRPMETMADGLRARWTIAASGDPKSADHSLAIQVRDVVSKDLAKLTSNDSPAQISIDIRMAKTPLAIAPKVASWLEDWRTTNGSLDVVEATFRQATTELIARGALKLDDGHRPAGQINIEARGANDIARNLGVPATLLEAGSILGGFREGNAAAPLRLPLALRGGQLFVGPLPTPIRFFAIY